jgi:NAD(P)-dependent dehydrogenase (short-subunit alcohol dehydrogenase family)
VKQINGNVAVVTGGGSGIGRALANALAAEGASVVVADILQQNARLVADEITAKGGAAVPTTCDVSDRAAVKRLKAEANAAFGPVTLLFANAGATSFERLTDMSEQDLDWIIQVDLMGVANCLLAFLPDMYAARSGHVVATGSMAGVLPGWIPYHSAYSSAKAGVLGLMMNLRYEAAEFGVGATVLCPGGVETSIKNNNSLYRPDRFGGPQQASVRIPEGSFAHIDIIFRAPEEVAQMVLESVRENRPMVVTDPTMRKAFMESYVSVVLEAFDHADAFDRRTKQ